MPGLLEVARGVRGGKGHIYDRPPHREQSFFEAVATEARLDHVSLQEWDQRAGPALATAEAAGRDVAADHSVLRRYIIPTAHGIRGMKGCQG